MITIDLSEYIKEVDAFTKMARHLIDRTSLTELNNVVASLEHGQKAMTEFRWRTNRCIKSVESSRYDGQSKDMPPLQFIFSFNSTISPNRDATRKKPQWLITQMNCSMMLCGKGDTTLGAFHVDLKDQKQIGPTIHFQFAESTEPGKIKSGIPRIPFGIVLPTDCLDFALSEVFPMEWPQSQVGAYYISKIIEGQQHRIEEVQRRLQNGWKGVEKQRTPVAFLQNQTFTELSF